MKKSVVIGLAATLVLLGAGPVASLPPSIAGTALLVDDEIRLPVTAVCFEDATVRIDVSQRGRWRRAVTGTRTEPLYCWEEGNQKVMAVTPTMSGRRFHGGSAFAVLVDTECFRSGGDYLCDEYEPRWRVVEVVRHDPGPSTRESSGETPRPTRRSTQGPWRSAPAESTAGTLNLSVAVLKRGASVLDGSGALVRVRARCAPGPENFGYYERARLTLTQRRGGSLWSRGTIDASTYASLPCDDEQHTMTLPVVPDNGHRFRLGSARVEATYGATFADGVVREVSTRSRIMLRRALAR